MESKQDKPKHQFSVAIDLELPSDVVKRITAAIQKAVLLELATVDLRSGFNVDFLGGAGGARLPNGSTQGIQIEPPRI